MPISAYTPKDLVLFSTIINAATRQKNWDTELTDKAAGSKVEEVQCMRIDERLFIACNYGEHARVDSFFKAFGVTDLDTFLQCMRFCHGLLKMNHSDKISSLGRSFTACYSEPEKASCTYAAASTAVTALSADELEFISNLLKKTPAIPADIQAKRILWALRKLTDAGAITDFTKPSSTKSLMTKNYDTNPNAINLLNDSLTVHAELKLLRLLTQTKIGDNPLNTHKSAAIGGIKRACQSCSKWIASFVKWIKAQFDVDIELPAPDTRVSASGDGDRPQIDKDRIEVYGEYVVNLFKGGKNDNFLDLPAAEEPWPLVEQEAQ
ncbi:hypothetical protein [Phytopseudomonas dryadis]|uniref:Uncharacterized protein n=1 Tax=Phytopseudomonas dryadis TaxID=2487520 RepID=A0A4Q9R6P4_9GAMM|nr:hypothetical protein [Pseudomonas dryadis]TBU95654.1 hypothetical protein DNK44_06965 [Pseudomonas dryadis]